MSTVQEIESAIRSLSAEDRIKLVEGIPELLPELNGDAAWERIIRDSRPRPALTALADGLEVEFARNPGAFPEIQDGDFDKRA